MGVLRQGPCEFCGSHDAMTLYEDGGFHCFSCHAHQPGNTYKKMMEKLTSTLKPVAECPPLPEDASPLVFQYPYDGSGPTVEGCQSSKAYFWLKKYNLTDAEIDRHMMLWSEEKQLLIFPVLNEVGEVLMWQGRYFGDRKTHPKYLTRGLKESLVHIIGEDKPGPLVLTEDLISAIKVSRVAPAMPLWGSSLSSELVEKLKQQYPTVILFLDHDKREAAIRTTIKYCLHLHIVPVVEKLDPKNYSSDELIQILKNANHN